MLNMAFEPVLSLIRRLQGTVSRYADFPIVQNREQMALLRELQKEMQKRDPLNIPFDQLDVVAIDLETTGFFPDKGDEIISIGAVKVSGKKVCDDQTFYSLVKHEKPLAEEIKILTGISYEQLKAAPPLPEVLHHFFHFIRDCILIAHHAGHEKNFLQRACWKSFRSPFPHRIVDISFLSRIAEPDLKHAELEEICACHAIPVVNRHHALGDALLAARVWSLYIEKVEKKGCRTLRELYERLAKSG
ncbi:exonuclease domain-containing protein [Caldibacillus debilis]|nr:exonuclease domain-containing protein [Caldibacillus debilis]